MKYFGSIFYQSLILFVSFRFGFGESFENDLLVEQVTVDGVQGWEQKRWEGVTLSKDKKTDKHIFKDPELNQICGGIFSSVNVEIVEVFERIVRISLTRRTMQFSHLFINMLFSVRGAAQVFVEEIRSRQKTEQEYSDDLPVAKLFYYLIERDDIPFDGERLQLFVRSPKFFLKKWKSRWFSDPITINFVKYDGRIRLRFSGLHLVLQSGTFNVSDRIGTNTYILCSENIVTYFFIALFPDDETAAKFYASVMSHLNGQIPCPASLLTPEILETMNSL